MVKEFTLRMPEEIHEILMNIKKNFRIGITSKIMDYIARGLIKDGYFPIEKIIEINGNKKQPICDDDK